MSATGVHSLFKTTKQNLKHKKKSSVSLTKSKNTSTSRYSENHELKAKPGFVQQHPDDELRLEVCPVCQFPFKYLTGQSIRWHASECYELQEKDVNGDCPYGLKCDSFSTQHYRKYYHTLQAAARSGGSLTEHLDKGTSKHEDSKENGSLSSKENGSRHSPSFATLVTHSSEENVPCNLNTERSDLHVSTSVLVGDSVVNCSIENENSHSSSIDLNCTDNMLKDNFIDTEYEDIYDEIVAELENNPDFESHSEKETRMPRSNASHARVTTVVKNIKSDPVMKNIKSDPTLSVSVNDEKINNETHDEKINNETHGFRTQSKHLIGVYESSDISSCNTSHKSLIQKDVGTYFGLKPIKKPEVKPEAISTGSHMKPNPWGSSGGKGKRSHSSSTQFDTNETTNEAEHAGAYGNHSGAYYNGNNSGASSSKRKCPFYKKIPDTPFTVDAFNYGNIPGCSAYFLSHFHYDHYQGLTKNFKNKIYCSKITSNLVISKIRVPSQRVHVLPMHQTVCVEGVRVCLLEANHCPGSVMFLFELSNGKTILHTGDFRATKEMANFSELMNKQIDVLYLDTTYCLPCYNFPTQNDVIEFAVSVVGKAIVNQPKTLIVCGSYTIGKERVFVAIAKALDCKICVRTDKKRILNCLQWDEVDSRLATKWNEAQIHVLPMKSLSIKGMEDHLRTLGGHFTHILAFKPTGWTYTGKMERLEDIKPVRRGLITIYGIPYSEHSSFSELEWFVRHTQPKKIIPTVNVGSPQKRNEMQKTFIGWLSHTQGTQAKQTKLK